MSPTKTENDAWLRISHLTAGSLADEPTPEYLRKLSSELRSFTQRVDERLTAVLNAESGDYDNDDNEGDDNDG